MVGWVAHEILVSSQGPLVLGFGFLALGLWGFGAWACQLSFIECLMRMSRFGVAESHGRGAALQLNTFIEDGAVSYNSSSGKYEVRQFTRVNCHSALLYCTLYRLTSTN